METTKVTRLRLDRYMRGQKAPHIAARDILNSQQKPPRKRKNKTKTKKATNIEHETTPEQPQIHRKKKRNNEKQMKQWRRHVAQRKKKKK